MATSLHPDEGVDQRVTRGGIGGRALVAVGAAAVTPAWEKRWIPLFLLQIELFQRKYVLQLLKKVQFFR